MPSSCSSQTHLSLEIEWKVLQVCSGMVDQQRRHLMCGDGRYRSDADEVFYRQFVEDQEQYINREVQQREMLHGDERRE